MPEVSEDPEKVVLRLPGPRILDRATKQRTSSKQLDAEFRSYMERETGMDRIRTLLALDEQGKLQDCIKDIGYITKNTAVTGTIFFTFVGAKEARAEFKKKNLNTKWKTRLMSAKAITDATFIGGFKTGMKFGLGIAAGSVLLLGSGLVIAAYRNKTSPFDLVPAGAIGGALVPIVQSNHGLHIIAKSTAIGAGGSLIAGAVFYWLKLSYGKTYEKQHYWWVYNHLASSRIADKETPAKQINTEQNSSEDR